MSRFSNYDPARVSASFNGVRIEGYAEGTFINVERSEDAFSMSAGGSGDVVRVRSRNRTGSVTFTVQRGSPTNERLNALAIQDDNFGTGYGALFVKDHNGKIMIEAPIAWIKKLPTIEYGNDAGNMEWVIDCAELFVTMQLPVALE